MNEPNTVSFTVTYPDKLADYWVIRELNVTKCVGSADARRTIERFMFGYVVPSRNWGLYQWEYGETVASSEDNSNE